MNHFSLKNKVALVTGATTGIGLAIVEAFKEAGATVFLHGRKEELTTKIAKAHGVLPVWADLNNPEEKKALIRQIKSQTDVIDILVNNAGFEVEAGLQDFDLTSYQQLQEVNVETPMWLTQQLLPLLKKSQSASVINVTSIHESIPVRNNGYYCMSKAALAMYTKNAALEFGKEGIRFNNLAPGAIRTKMNAELIAELPFEEWIPLQRVGAVEEVAGPALFLASDASSYVTGTTLTVDGGYSENLLRY